jgi:hypothetical protein
VSLRLRLALIAAIVVLGGYSALHHGTKWTTYHDKHGWTIAVPQSFDISRDSLGARFVSVHDEGSGGLPESAFSLAVTSGPRKTLAADTTLPLDPVALHVPKAVTGRDLGVLELTFYHRRRIYELSVVMHGSHWQGAAARMIRSLRFDD